MKKIIFVLSLIFVLGSCSSTFYYVDAYPHTSYKQASETIDSTANLDIEIKYGGDALDYFVFQMDVINDTESIFYVSSDQIFIDYKEGPGLSSGFKMKALDKHQFLTELEEEKVSIQKEKRIRNVGNVLITGLGIIGSIFTGDATYAAQAIVDGTSEMVLDRNHYKLVSKDIDEQIEYVQDWVIEDFTVYPGDSISYDILFESIAKPIYCEVELLIEREKFSFPFDMILRKSNK